MRLAVAVGPRRLVVVVVLLVRGCGGGAADERRRRRRRPRRTGDGADDEGSRSRSPACRRWSSMGDTVRFQTPEGAVVRVTASDYADPGDAAGRRRAPTAGERLVTLELTVTPEGAEGTAAVTAAVRKADSFILIAEDDTLTVAQLGGRRPARAPTCRPVRPSRRHARLLRRRGRPAPLRVHAGRGLPAALGDLGPGS